MENGRVSGSTTPSMENATSTPSIQNPNALSPAGGSVRPLNGGFHVRYGGASVTTMENGRVNGITTPSMENGQVNLTTMPSSQNPNGSSPPESSVRPLNDGFHVRTYGSSNGGVAQSFVNPDDFFVENQGVHDQGSGDPNAANQPSIPSPSDYFLAERNSILPPNIGPHYSHYPSLEFLQQFGGLNLSFPCFPDSISGFGNGLTNHTSHNLGNCSGLINNAYPTINQYGLINNRSLDLINGSGLTSHSYASSLSSSHWPEYSSVSMNYQNVSSTSGAWSSETINQRVFASQGKQTNNSLNDLIDEINPPQFSDLPNGLGLKDLMGQLCVCAKDKNYSEFLQNAIIESNVDEFDMIFSELIDDVGRLSINQNGSEVVKVLIENCSNEQRTLILNVMISTGFLCHCLDHKGTHVVQKLLRFLNSEEQILTVIHALSSIAVQLATNPNGNRLIQFCLGHFSREYNQILLEDVANNCADLARDKQGCCMLQHAIKYSSGRLRRRFVVDIIRNAVQLSDNLYGNYLVQYVLELRDPAFTECLLHNLRGHYMDLAISKHGSHVVEKCLNSTLPWQSERILIELINDPRISLLFVDACGNYVIQSALQVSRGHLRIYLLRLVQINYPMMSSNKYGQKVLEFVGGKKGAKR